MNQHDETSTGYQPFEVMTVPLRPGENAVEASAGTGKTYSIAVLALRLLLEKRIPLEEILMVTFTNAAVAELSERVRRFIKSALRYAGRDAPDTDPLIRQLVDRSITAHGQETTRQRLAAAVSSLDETAVFTIHGFCQRTLKEFAFETKQVLDAELVTEEDGIIERAVNTYWRQRVVERPLPETELMITIGISRGAIVPVVREALKDKVYANSGKTAGYDDVRRARREYEDQLTQEHTVIRENETALMERLQGTQTTKEPMRQYFRDKLKTGAPLRDEDTYSTVIFTKNGGVRKNFADWTRGSGVTEYYETVVSLRETLANTYEDYRAGIHREAVEFCTAWIGGYKRRENLLSQNDLIGRLYDRVRPGGGDPAVKELADKLAGKYRALFIDEFQDTDHKQYRIFHTLFPESVIFFIGDPKQSIYRFRDADLDSYQRAVTSIAPERRYTMNQNFRSNRALVDAMNRFFDVDDPFLSGAIHYIPVESAVDNACLVTDDGKPCAPFTLCRPEEDTTPHDDVARRIADLLAGGYAIERRDDTNGDTPVREPLSRDTLDRHSIGVLVRAKAKGILIRDTLRRRGIPAVMINDAKVLETETARAFRRFLEAALTPSEQTVKTALLTPLAGMTPPAVRRLDDTDLLGYVEFFQSLRPAGGRVSVLTVCRRVMDRFQLKTRLLGERRLHELSHIQQTMELLYNREQSRGAALDELVSWIQRVQSGQTEEGDEYVERIESDEAAVQICTIHASKGLSYDIVFAPYLNQLIKREASSAGTVVSYKTPGGKAPGKTAAADTVYFTDRFDADTWERDKEAKRQEQRRLIYVAVTRARYKVFLIDREEKNHELGPFIEAISSAGPKLVEIRRDTGGEENGDAPPTDHVSDGEPYARTPPVLRPVDFSASFSSLDRSEHTYQAKEELPVEGYDRFIFTDLPRGTAAGNFLHALYEEVDFTAGLPAWRDAVRQTGRCFPTLYDDRHLDRYGELVGHSVRAALPCGFRLSDIQPDRYRAEMAFYFRAELSTGRIEEILARHGVSTPGVREETLRGAVNGFIDLVFEHGGRYYLLDWKSNHLGWDTADYAPERLETAMTENNYHLQYLLYSVALKRHLEQRGISFAPAFGGVLYCFVRGLRQDRHTGVFFRSGPDLRPVIDTLDAAF